MQSLSTITPLLMGVFVYARHTPDCPKRADRFWRRCRCPKWLRGTVAGREVRKSAKTRSWEKAQIVAHSIENGDASKSPIDAPKNPVEPQRMTIRSAVEAFLDDEQGRHLRRGTTGQSQTLLNRQLLDWARERGLDYLDELTAPVLAKFRAHWSQELGNGQNTARRKHERLCGFFHFCIRNEWIAKNPARLLKPIRVERVPTGRQLQLQH